MTQKEALAKLQKYCAYQDRCHKEVRSKLLKLGVYGDELEEVICQLIEEKFLDEMRFALSFVRGKFRIKYWGRNRILRELKIREISAYCINKAMEGIEEDSYLATLKEVILRKKAVTNGENKFLNNKKIAEHAIRKGFEPDLVWAEIKKMADQNI